MHRRWLIPLLTMLLLWWLVAQINHYLAPHGAYLYVGGLLIIFGALRLSLRAGLAATLLAGLAIDAVEPVPFGTHLLLLGAAHIILFRIRMRFPREEALFALIAALIANLALFLGVSFLLLSHHPAPWAAWPRLFADLGWSQLCLALIAPWFLALQQRAMELGRVDLAKEIRRPF